jgi:N,N'-diacetyllegionaminate synthase
MTKRSVMKIRDRVIGDGEPTFVIAEIGVNHDGSLDRGMELVKIARECGADAVKLQIFKAAQLMHRSSAFAEYQKSRCEQADPLEMLRKYELSKDEVRALVQAIDQHGMVPLATPFSLEDVGTIEAMELPALKIASPDIVNLPLLRRAVALEKPMLVSTGAATMQEVARAAGWLNEARASYGFLHCVSSYPVSVEFAHLGWIGELRERFGIPIGYSDHTTETIAGALAVASGACVVEKHLTCDRMAKGPDHFASADGDQFAKYVQAIRLAERLRGSAAKHVLPAEEDVRNVSRQSLVASQDVAAGEILRASHLIVQRPGTGISAADFDRIVGQRAIRHITAGTLLQREMLSDA